jgi:hypothetical protein
MELILEKRGGKHPALIQARGRLTAFAEIELVSCFFSLGLHSASRWQRRGDNKHVAAFPFNRSDPLAFLALSLIGDQMYTMLAGVLYYLVSDGTSASVKCGLIPAHTLLQP